MFLIHGVFFQEQQWLGARIVPIEGIVAVIESGLLFSMYAGLICGEERNPDRLAGGMIDHYGESTLSEIDLVPEKQFAFTKKYNRRSDSIRYNFTTRHSDLWIGTYEGPLVGRGVTHCYVKEVPKDFCSPAKCLEQLRRIEVKTSGKK